MVPRELIVSAYLSVQFGLDVPLKPCCLVAQVHAVMGAIGNPERRLTLACVLDLVCPEGLKTRQKAYTDILRAADDYKIHVHHIEFDRLETNKITAVLDLMYNADVAIVDMSLSSQQIGLSGHLGSRERFGMQGNIILYHSEMVHGLFKGSIGMCGRKDFWRTSCWYFRTTHREW